jgi:hypothetical protein
MEAVAGGMPGIAAPTRPARRVDPLWPFSIGLSIPAAVAIATAGSKPYARTIHPAEGFST